MHVGRRQYLCLQLANRATKRNFNVSYTSRAQVNANTLKINGNIAVMWSEPLEQTHQVYIATAGIIKHCACVLMWQDNKIVQCSLILANMHTYTGIVLSTGNIQ